MKRTALALTLALGLGACMGQNTIPITVNGVTSNLSVPVTITIGAPSTPAPVPVPTPTPTPVKSVPVISAFTATPSTVAPGQKVTLSWTVTGADSLTVSGGGGTGSVTGLTSIVGSPTASGVYTLTAMNSTGSATKSVTVTVSQPAPTPTPTPAPNPNPTPVGTVGSAALTACGNITAAGSYYLANDVTSPGTCFPLGANNITINLNGHTITYGTAGGSAPTPAISACSSWYSGLSATQCLGGGGNLTVYGGKIVQSANAAPFSPVFWMGQGDNGGGGYIHDLTATFQSVGSQFFHGEVDGGGYKIQNNIINDGVTNIEHPGQGPLGARAQFQGYVIHTDEESSGTPKPDDISGNTFNGTAQGGVADGEVNAQIYNNLIHLTSSYSNDYGVIVTVDGQNVYDNTIDGRGRGLDAESSGFILHHNTINVAEQANNTEYSGCELAGTYGIRIKNYDWPNSTETGKSPSTNFQVTNNTVTTPATVCDASAFDLTDMNSLVSGVVSGNTFTATAGAGSLADALHLNSIDAAKITFTGNTFTAPTCLVIGGGGDIPYGTYSVQAGQNWSCPTGPTIVTQDYTYGQPGGTAPLIGLQDQISKATVSCGSYSTARVSVGGTVVATCSRKGN